MVRSFTDRTVAPDVLDGILDLARRAPSAGHTQGIDLVVLQGRAETEQFWDRSLPGGEPVTGTMPFPQLPRADVVVVVTTSPEAYVARYRESDKATAGWGAGSDVWPVPYWWVDAGAVMQNLLLAVTAAGLGACFFSAAHIEAELVEDLDVPAGHRVVGAVAIGHSSRDDEPSGSAIRRPRRPLGEVVHRGGW